MCLNPVKLTIIISGHTLGPTSTEAKGRKEEGEKGIKCNVSEHGLISEEGPGDTGLHSEFGTSRTRGLDVNSLAMIRRWHAHPPRKQNDHGHAIFSAKALPQVVYNEDHRLHFQQGRKQDLLKRT